jgi:hypothetical protein
VNARNEKLDAAVMQPRMEVLVMLVYMALPQIDVPDPIRVKQRTDREEPTFP